MAEIEEEMARAAALAAFQQKLEDEKAAAAKSTAAYQSKLAREAEIAARMKQLEIERELALFWKQKPSLKQELKLSCSSINC